MEFAAKQQIPLQLF